MKITHIFPVFNIFLVVWCQSNQTNVSNEEIIENHEKKSDFKYILMYSEIWNINQMKKLIPTGQDFFISNHCPVQNCFFVWSKSYFTNITDYDALIFHGPHVNTVQFPTERSPNQVYMFVNKEAPRMHSICNPALNTNIFNATATYRLDSDIKYLYLTVRNKQGEIIGPKKEMHWMKVDDMLPIGDNIKNKLSWKYKAAAWLVSNCQTSIHRELFVVRLQRELEKYMLRIEIYGFCGKRACGVTESQSMNLNHECWSMIQTEYFFYLAFENSFCEDYVSEKLLNALKYFTVPIVFGGANYTRFMPDGIYLDARKLGVKRLAKEMYALMQNRERYYNYFKWHNHYSYHDPTIDGETDLICQTCAYLNNKQKIDMSKSYTNFTQWWDGPGVCEKIKGTSSCESDNIEPRPIGNATTLQKMFRVIKNFMHDKANISVELNTLNWDVNSSLFYNIFDESDNVTTATEYLQEDFSHRRLKKKPGYLENATKFKEFKYPEPANSANSTEFPFRTKYRDMLEFEMAMTKFSELYKGLKTKTDTMTQFQRTLTTMRTKLHKMYKPNSVNLLEFHDRYEPTVNSLLELPVRRKN